MSELFGISERRLSVLNTNQDIAQTENVEISVVAQRIAIHTPSRLGQCSAHERPLLSSRCLDPRLLLFRSGATYPGGHVPAGFACNVLSLRTPISSAGCSSLRAQRRSPGTYIRGHALSFKAYQSNTAHFYSTTSNAQSTMTANIVLPSLTNWAEQHVQAIFNATTQSDFDSAFDNFLAQNAKITVNGKHISRDQYKTRLQAENPIEVQVSLTFDGAVEVPTNQNEPINAGTVGLFYNAEVPGRFFVFGARQTSALHSSLNLVIEQDKSIKPPTTIGKGGDFDPRRVSVLNEVALEQANPIVPPTGSAN
ncbi:hypothetical protein OBBRIDRAFT_402393 [Obba rivulosa]|uniref:Uncharacterized protein n=1 Tax=Obba rivulosa TaxID=1052685 RepID=A0A8E2DNE9_9APHY|nr:hypothetical protein OBBRIDRAFT_402393 [Obba rivulosa]